MPFWDLSIFDRYLPQMKSISKELGHQPNVLFHMVYVNKSPQQEWKKFFSFHKIEIPYKFVKSKTFRFLLYTYGRSKLNDELKDLDVDVVYTLNGLWLQSFSRNFSRKMKVPYVVRIRGNLMDVRNIMVKNPIKRRILNYVDARSLKQADLVIPISTNLARKAEEWGVKREKIVPPVPIGVNTTMFKPMSVKRDERFTVAYAGRISPEKRVSHLLRIAERLPNIRFILAGRLQMRLSLPNNVKYLGEIPHSKMPIFYNKADIIVLPSLTEGFPCTILEAYACEKPVLVAKEAFPEELKLFGSVVHINHFGTEIISLKNSNLKLIGRQARSYVKEYYTWEKFGRTISNYLRGLIK